MNVYIPYTRLPSAYQEVEYISSSNQQYIETGLSSNGSYLKADYKFQLLSTSSNVSTTPPFVRGPVVTGQIYQTINSSRTNFQFGAGNDDIELGSISTNTDYTVVAEWNNGTLSTNINGTTSTNSYSGGLSTHTIPIFCRWRSTSSGYDVFSSIKLYYFKLYTASNTLARDLVPCYRKSDSVIGMYDLVNNQFYTNSGTGTFSKGDDVTMSVLKNIYIGEYNCMGVLPSTVCSYPFIENNTDLTGKTTLSSGGTKQTIGYRFSGTSDISYGSGGVATSIFASYRIKSNIAYRTNGNCLVGGTEKGRMGYNVSHVGGYQNAAQFSNGTWYKSNTLGTVDTRMHLAYGFNGTEAYVYKNGVKQVIATSTTYEEAVNKYFIDWNGSQYDVTVAYFLLDGIDREDEIVPFFNKTKSQFGL